MHCFPSGVPRMEATERYTRMGDVLKWEATVSDPEAFLEPWVWNPWYLRVHPDKDANITEDRGMVEASLRLLMKRG